MPKVPAAREEHGDVLLVAGGDGVGVVFGTTGLDDGGDTGPGGLVDTVTDCSLENLDDGSASGFVFHELTESALLAALRRAFALRRRDADWRAVQRHAMSLRFDWALALDGPNRGFPGRFIAGYRQGF